MQFGAEQPDARGAGIGDVRKIDVQAGIDQQRHFLAVLGHARNVAQRLILLLPTCAKSHALGIGGLHVGQRTQMQITRRAVDDDGVARIGDTGCIVDVANCWNAEGARDDGDV